MEFLEGRSLKDYLNGRGGKLSFQETVSLLLPVMKALSAVHHEGMLHRDIAPDNIYVTDDGQVKLMDFGAARYHTFLETQSIRTIVKPVYAPMEQYTNQSHKVVDGCLCDGCNDLSSAYQVSSLPMPLLDI